MPASQYRLKTVDRAFRLMRVIRDANRPLTLSEVADMAETSTSNTFRLLQTLVSSGHLARDGFKRYAPTGGDDEIDLARGLALLDALAAAPGGILDTAGLAATIDANPLAVGRALARLVDAGVVERRPDQGGWALAPTMLRFLRPLMNDQFLARTIRPLMHKLGDEYGETVSWFVARGWEQVVVDVVPSREPICFVLETGGRQPCHLGAAGKAHLAALPTAQVRAFLDDLQPRQMTRFRLDKARMLEELDAIRRRGFATSVGERVEGAAAVAAAVPGSSGAPAGVISLMMPRFRVRRGTLDRMGRALVAEISMLGLPMPSSQGSAR